MLAKFPNSEFSILHSSRIIVHPSTTTLKWDPDRKHKDITLLGKIDTAKVTVANGIKGVLTSKKYTIGTDTDKWYFVVNEKSNFYAGIAPDNQPLNSVASLSTLINPSMNDRVRFCLSTTMLVMRHETSGGDTITKQVWYLSDFSGSIMSGWASTTKNETFALKVLQDVDFEMYVREDGKIVMTGSNNDIVDFDLQDIADNGGYTLAETDKIENKVSGASVEAKDNGSILINGGIVTKCSTAAIAPSISLLPSDYHVIIADATTTSVMLPAISVCESYVISRSYPLQVGEDLFDPVLVVYPAGADTIEGEAEMGIPPNATLKLTSDGTTWRIF